MPEIVRYDPTWTEPIARLQRNLWGGDPRLNTAYFEWKYLENPYSKTPLLQLAIEEGRLVGMRGFFGSCWEAGEAGRPVLVPSGDDFVIDPTYRNRGLAGAIMRAAIADLDAKGYEYAFSLSAGPVTTATLLAAGWRAVGPMRPARRTSPGGVFLDRVATRLEKLPMLWRIKDPLVRLAHRGGGFRRLDRRLRRAPGRSPAVVWMESEPRVEAMADLVRRLGHDGRIRHARDETYLRWRYRNPLHEYRFLYQGADALDGYLVLQTHRVEPERGVNIVDWEATGDDARKNLIRTALSGGGFRELAVWTAALPSAAPVLLTEAGFSAPPSRSPLLGSTRTLIRQVKKVPRANEPLLAGRRLLDPESWDMRMVYSMAG
jgi:GNAT superfamily N-acetyltransferase